MRLHGGPDLEGLIAAAGYAVLFVAAWPALRPVFLDGDRDGTVLTHRAEPPRSGGGPVSR